MRLLSRFARELLDAEAYWYTIKEFEPEYVIAKERIEELKRKAGITK